MGGGAAVAPSTFPLFLLFNSSSFSSSFLSNSFFWLSSFFLSLSTSSSFFTLSKLSSFFHHSFSSLLSSYSDRLSELFWLYLSSFQYLLLFSLWDFGGWVGGFFSLCFTLWVLFSEWLTTYVSFLSSHSESATLPSVVVCNGDGCIGDGGGSTVIFSSLLSGPGFTCLATGVF